MPANVRCKSTRFEGGLNGLAAPGDMRRHWREQRRKAEAWRLGALAAFVNLDGTPRALQTFRRKYPAFEPFEILDAEGKRVSVMAPRFNSMVLAWRDLLQLVWRGQAGSWELENLLGLNPDGAFGRWVGNALFVVPWNTGLKAAQDAGFQFPPYYPVVRSRWSDGDFSYESGSAFQNAVYALWRKRWRARICRMCKSYFIARKVAQRYCSKFCFQQGKNERNRKWWQGSGPDWRKRVLAEKAKAERRARRKKGAK